MRRVDTLLWEPRHAARGYHAELIIWRDSTGDYGWQDLDRPDRLEVAPIVSVGFVTAEDDQAVALTSGVSMNNKGVDPIVIPKESICERHRVELPKVEPERWARQRAPVPGRRARKA